MIAKRLPLDKVKHFMAGVFICLIVSVAFSHDLDPLSASLTGFAAAVLIGVLKEAVWDTWLGRGVSDKYDLFATMGGGVFGALVVWGFLIYD